MFHHTRRVLVVLALLLAILTVGSAAAQDYDFNYVYVSVAVPGTTEDGLEYGSADIIGSAGLGQPWFTFFDGEAHGLTDHILNAFDFEAAAPTSTADAPTGPIYLSFARSRFRIPDIPGWVYAQDVVKFTPTLPVAVGGDYEFVFDGSDVGLTTLDERIDALSVWTPTVSTVPDDCPAGVLFISTMRNYRVPAAGGGSLTGPGGDILAFCATNLGADTAGFWYRAFSAAAAGLSPRQAIRSISIHDFAQGPGPSDWWLEFSFIARTPFTLGSFSGAANTIYLYDTNMGVKDTLLDMSYDYPVLNGQASGLLIDVEPLICANAC